LENVTVFSEVFHQKSYDNWISTYVCSGESDTFSAAFLHVILTSLTHSNCPHKQTWHCTRCCESTS